MALPHGLLLAAGLATNGLPGLEAVDSGERNIGEAAASCCGESNMLPADPFMPQGDAELAAVTDQHIEDMGLKQRCKQCRWKS